MSDFEKKNLKKIFFFKFFLYLATGLSDTEFFLVICSIFRIFSKSVFLSPPTMLLLAMEENFSQRFFFFKIF